MTKYKAWANGGKIEEIFDSYEEAMERMYELDLQLAGTSCDNAKEYWTETGEMKEGDNGTYTHRIETIEEE